MTLFSHDDAFKLVENQLGLLREMNDVKRLFAQNLNGRSFTTVVFLNSVLALHSGEQLHADMHCAAIVTAARLGAITTSVLLNSGLSRLESRSIFENSILIHECLPPSVRSSLQAACEQLSQYHVEGGRTSFDWATRLTTAPRAGATCPGKARIVLEPPEMHSDHCVVVASYAYLLADIFGANREDAWLIGLCHHLHNAYLPDAGFTGEDLLGDHLTGIIGKYRRDVMATFSDHYRDRVVRLFGDIDDLNSPLAQTFHAADTIDRVIQMEHYARAAEFSVSKAINDLNLVHDGQAQEFQHSLLQSIGMSYKSAP